MSKKLWVFGVISFLAPWIALAVSFERDLYFGLKNNPEVTRLQEFLKKEAVYTGPVTGNFFSLTKEGVVNFQKREKIEPALGYFGVKTRARANKIVEVGQPPPALSGLSFETQNQAIASLKAKIEELNAQLEVLKKKQTEEALTPTSTPSVEPPSQPQTPIEPIPPPPTELRVATKKIYSFPDIETTPWKIGEFTVSNTLGKDVLFASFDTLVIDEMDSPLNRNRKVYFFLRDGTEATDTQISKTEFTFILSPPPAGQPHKSILNFPFNVLLKNGEKKTISLWVDLLKYVRSGTFEIKSTQINITDSFVSPLGEFDFILTKEPPL